MRWKNTSFPLYDEMQYLVHGIVAMGAGAFHPGRTPSPTPSDSLKTVDLDQSMSTQPDRTSSLCTVDLQASLLSDKLTKETEGSIQVIFLLRVHTG